MRDEGRWVAGLVWKLGWDGWTDMGGMGCASGVGVGEREGGAPDVYSVIYRASQGNE